MSLHELDLALKVSDVIACVEGDHIGKTGTPEEVFSGDYIQKLYGVDAECFDPRTGAVYLRGNKSRPKIFVIGRRGQRHTGLSCFTAEKCAVCGGNSDGE